MGLLVVAAGAVAQEGVSFGDNWAHTVAGDLSIQYTDGQQQVVSLKGVPILHSDDEYHYTFNVIGVYPPQGPARLVLLQFDTGDNYCRYMDKVLEFGANGSTRMSPDFGNCLEYNWGDGDKAKARQRSSLRYVDGAWKIGLPPEEKGRRAPDWFTYKDGGITPRYKVMPADR